MTVTLAELINEVEADLSDSGNSTFAAADIERWLRDAIKDYSQYLPIEKLHDITTSADDRQYDLNDGFVEPLSIEYPQGEDPPQYLKRRPYTHPDFWTIDGYYDILTNEDDTNPNELLISTKPATDEHIYVTYHGIHDYTLITSANLTVPAKHHHILRAYARWKATLFLVSQEEASPTSNSSLLMSQLAANARRWEREYKNALAQAIQANYGRSQVTSWANQTDESTRIY